MKNYVLIFTSFALINNSLIIASPPNKKKELPHPELMCGEKSYYRMAIAAGEYGNVLSDYPEASHKGWFRYHKKGVEPFCYILADNNFIKKTYTDSRIVSVKKIDDLDQEFINIHNYLLLCGHIRITK